MAVLDRQIAAAASGQVLVINRVEGLDQARAGDAFQHFLAGGGVAEIIEAAVGAVGIHRVDDDFTFQDLRRRQSFRRAPRDGEQHYVAEARCIGDGHGVGPGTKFSDELAQRLRAA